jgi:hypothetical protein
MRLISQAEEKLFFTLGVFLWRKIRLPYNELWIH